MVGLGAVPPVSCFRTILPEWTSFSDSCESPGFVQILQLGLLSYLPESPRYLLRRDKLAETVDILRKVYPYATEEQLHLKAEVIRDSVKKNMGHQGSFIQTWKRLHFVGANFRGLVIACGLQGIQQLCG
jgi:SP family myo-inositol transporter-like MFS transporter 13